ASVVFNDLLAWLNELSEKYALDVTQLDVKQAETTGMVNTEKLELTAF
ncbi:type II secretion system protein M, partial [Escherichia coli]|nr:type II secretion system protein M [Escherichia coli]